MSLTNQTVNKRTKKNLLSSLPDSIKSFIMFPNNSPTKINLKPKTGCLKFRQNIYLILLKDDLGIFSD
jgi:hypothetical protein